MKTLIIFLKIINFDIKKWPNMTIILYYHYCILDITHRNQILHNKVLRNNTSFCCTIRIDSSTYTKSIGVFYLMSCFTNEYIFTVLCI